MEIDDNWEFENLMRGKTKICYFVSPVFVYCGEAIWNSSELGSLLVGITLEGKKLLTLLSNALSKK